MPCEKWYKLLERYRRSVKIYSRAVDGLSGSDFNTAWQSAEAALKNSGVARAMLLGHEHEHACDSGDWDTQEMVLGDQGQSGG
ncbi:MAG TPA: hypothetical protein VGG72_33280 [Bryobacteraceae bacterium]|jgi:hypothetical protein